MCYWQRELTTRAARLKTRYTCSKHDATSSERCNEVHANLIAAKSTSLHQTKGHNALHIQP